VIGFVFKIVKFRTIAQLLHLDLVCLETSIFVKQIFEINSKD